MRAELIRLKEHVDAVCEDSHCLDSAETIPEVVEALRVARESPANATPQQVAARVAPPPVDAHAGRVTARPVIQLAHGRDPRLAPSCVSENIELLSKLNASSAAKPHAAFASLSTAVAPLQSLAELDEALSAAAAENKLLVVKFYAPKCRACLSARPRYDAAAEALSDAASFYEVDISAAKVLTLLAKVERMPVVHIYDTTGTLCDTHAINNPPLHDAFIESMSLLASGFRP